MQTVYDPLITRKFIADASKIKAKTLSMLRMEMDLSWLEKKDYRIINNAKDLAKAIWEMKKAPYLAIDTETTGLGICNLSKDNPQKDHIVGMSISWKRNQGIYIPFDHTEFENMDKRVAFQMLYVILTQKTIITHNGIYDGKVFYDEGIKLNIKHDTLLIQFNLDSTVSKGSKGLKPLTIARYGYSVIELEDIFEYSKDYGLFRYVDYELTKAYACADSDHTFMLFEDSISELNVGQMRSYMYDIRVANNLIRSEYEGKGIDSKLLPVMNEINDRDIEKIENLIDRYVGMTLQYKKTGKVSEAIYKFQKTSLPTLGHVMFNLMEYPIVRVQESGIPVVDKNVLKYLDTITTKESDPVAEYLFSEDIESDIANYNFDWVHKKDRVILKAEKIKNKKYKLAMLISTWRKLEKLKTSFFAPLLNANYEGRYFSSISMTRAETARLIDFIQTLDKRLKRLVVPLGSGNYMIDYDYAQIEYRAMSGLSNCVSIVSQLEDPEADYHRIGGSVILGKAPEDITDDERKNLKSVNFGIPYGIGAEGIVTNRYGIGLADADHHKYLRETESLLIQWKLGLHEIQEMLDAYRDEAITPVPDSELPRHLKGKKMGRIHNPLGRTRLFNLENLTKAKIGSIRRQAGNYPIQSFAREIFCQGFCTLDERLVSEGLMDVRVPDDTMASGFRFENKVVIMAYIHDECLVSVDKSINPVWIMKLIAECTMMRLEGHPPYFTGISVVNNWYEGKDGHYEAPVKFIYEMAEEDRANLYSEQPRDIIEERMIKYIRNRALEEVAKFDPDWRATKLLRMDKIIYSMKNYFILPRIMEYIGSTRKCIKDSDNENYKLCPWKDELAACIENLCASEGYDLTVMYPDNTFRKIRKDDTAEGVKYTYSEREDDEEYAALLSDLDSADDDDIVIDAGALQTAFDRITDNLSNEEEPAETLSFIRP